MYAMLCEKNKEFYTLSNFRIKTNPKKVSIFDTILLKGAKLNSSSSSTHISLT